MKNKIYNFFREHTIVCIVAIVLVTILLCALLVRLTNGFTTFQRELNPNNLLANEYDDDEFKLENGIKYKIEKSVIKLNGTTRVSDASDIYAIAEPDFEIAKIKIPAGTYTFTCFDDADGVSAVGVWSDGGVTYTWCADVTDLKYVNGENRVPQTTTFEKETEVTFYIRVLQGVELKNVKGYPCVVKGDEPGEFYKGFFEK